MSDVLTLAPNPAPPLDAAPDQTGFELFENAAWTSAKPHLSVLTPFYRDDPRALLAALDAEAARLDGAVEIVLLDDCGGDLTLSEAVRAAVQTLASPARLIRLAQNQGRSRGRNQLIAHSRARHALFLDSDMAPDSERFLSAYLDLIAVEEPAVVFGGFSVDRAPVRPEHALHRALSQRGECLSASLRAQQPEKYVYTSNLLVRRDVFAAEAFDESFSGWGWEDVEWGLRVGRRFGVRHIDNSATHLGLDTAAALAAKYEQSPDNFARVLARHPEAVRGYPSYRLARALKRLPARGLWRRLLKALALADRAPVTARVAAMKIYRAALYSEVV
ncbi:glycosyltransferase family 2 protein [Caulobacter sp. S45]|uniref:glycosyltransferase family 2 protein n=1 Tax=Caulobacter sp. S45 TaxID=1641861 RepID=UPI00131AD515|nr:glycosyltransferase [Caulobacter sp. S45]